MLWHTSEQRTRPLFRRSGELVQGYNNTVKRLWVQEETFENCMNEYNPVGDLTLLFVFTLQIQPGSLSIYELERLENIRQNQVFLSSIKLLEVSLLKNRV